MKISRQQTKLLTELLTQIREELGIRIGYTNPIIGHYVEEDDLFIIFDSIGQTDEAFLHHRNDVEFRHQGPFVFSQVASFPAHEDEVQNLLDKVEEALMDGKIWFDPGIKRELGDIKYDIIRRDDFYKIEISDPEEDQVYIATYEELVKIAKKRKILKPALKFICEIWPRPTIWARLINWIRLKLKGESKGN